VDTSRTKESDVTTTSDRSVEARGRVRVEHGARRIRAYLGGELVADTTRPLLVWEHPRYPTYYFPAADVRFALLRPDAETSHSPSRGDAAVFTVEAGGSTRAGAAQHYEESPFETLRDTVRIEWDAMDAWFEEDEEVFVHARSPYTRVDILAGSRHVRVEVEGRPLAESVKPTLLFETGLPVRYYLPKTDVRMDLLTPSPSTSRCPYKGEAEYWSLAHDDSRVDVAWSYRTPLPESQKIAGLICFYPEKVELYVDGAPIERRDRG
jgi:uncharacterized protein (DUF427 family)